MRSSKISGTYTNLIGRLQFSSMIVRRRLLPVNEAPIAIPPGAKADGKESKDPMRAKVGGLHEVWGLPWAGETGFTAAYWES